MIFDSLIFFDHHDTTKYSNDDMTIAFKNNSLDSIKIMKEKTLENIYLNIFREEWFIQT